MLSSWLYGSAEDGPIDPPVPEGHRGIDIHIDGQTVRVDVDVLAPGSGLFLHMQAIEASEYALEEFPGGIEIFRQIVELLSSTAHETPQLHVCEENVLHMFEAAWLLECPRVFDAAMNSTFILSLSSRRAAELLESLLPFTTFSSHAEGHNQAGSADSATAHEQDLASLPELDGSDRDCAVQSEDFVRIFALETAMWQQSERAALKLAGQLDVTDFVLGPRLATGSLRVSCELLKLHRRRQEEVGFVSSALQPMSNMWKNWTDKPLRAKVEWDGHMFALSCIRKRVLLGIDSQGQQELAQCGEKEEDEEAKEDLRQEVVETVSDRVLLTLVELVEYVDISRVPPNWMALLVRCLLLSGQTRKARQAFVKAFPDSAATRVLVLKMPRVVPVAWLAEVSQQAQASHVLLRVLEGFREFSGTELCDVVERVLLKHFLRSPHCAHILLASKLIDDIVGACFAASLKAREPHALGTTSGGDDGKQATKPSRCPDHWAGSHVLCRLQHVGARLFSAAFVPQCGFLPNASRWQEEGGAEDGARSGVGRQPQVLPPCQPEPLVVTLKGSCLWDEGLLTLDLLNATMDTARAAPMEKTLHYGRQAIMRHLWHRHDGSYCPLPKLAHLWELACWPLCEDDDLIREAFEYLKGTYRELRGAAGQWHQDKEEEVFQLFAALDLARLPNQALLTPWVPPQLQAVRLMVTQAPAERFNAELQREIQNASESLDLISEQCLQLANRMNVVEQRTVMNKSQINNAIVAIEEHQRKKREPATSPRQPVAAT